MIRFTWMQFRIQALVALCALAIVAIVLGVTGPNLVHLYDTSRFATCGAHGDCSHDRERAAVSRPPPARPQFRIARRPRTHRTVLGGATRGSRVRDRNLPPCVGPGRHPHPLDCRQAGLVGLASMAVAGLFSLMVTWWSSPLDRVNPNQFSTLFAERGIVAIGYAAFAFALGVTAGLLIRRTLPAMVTTLVGYVIVRLGVTKLRPYFQAPLTLREKLATGAHGIVQSIPGAGAAPPPHLGDWVLSSNVLSASGQAFDQAKIACSIFVRPGESASSAHSAATACMARARTYSAGLRDVVTFQPSSRYWLFQSYEMAIFLGLAPGP